MKSPRTPAHNLLKVQTVLQKRDIPEVYRNAKAALDRYQRLFSPVSEEGMIDTDQTMTSGEAVDEDLPACTY